MTRLQDEYNNTIKANLVEEFGYQNVMEVPKLDKIVLLTPTATNYFE